MKEYLESVNAGYFYLLVAGVMAFITAICAVFLVKSYRVGIKIGMDKKVLRKTIVASASFTLLPSISILLGVIALSGTLGIPFSWLRLSVIGALQYELNVAEMSAQSLGMPKLDVATLNPESFATIALIMTVGILGGVFCCIFFLKKYLKKLSGKPKKAGESGKKSFGAYATTAMFIGLCAAYIGSYIGNAIPRYDAEGNPLFDVMPLIVAVIAGIVMAVFEFFIRRKKVKVLENFSLAASMLVAMAAAVGIAAII